MHAIGHFSHEDSGFWSEGTEKLAKDRLGIMKFMFLLAFPERSFDTGLNGCRYQIARAQTHWRQLHQRKTSPESTAHECRASALFTKTDGRCHGGLLVLIVGFGCLPASIVTCQVLYLSHT